MAQEAHEDRLEYYIYKYDRQHDDWPLEETHHTCASALASFDRRLENGEKVRLGLKLFPGKKPEDG